MAIKKKLIHFNSFASFISKKLSANKENTKYIDPSTFEQVDGSPDILFQSICYIKDIKQIWTHGEYFGNGVGCVNVTESKLRTMISNKALVPGMEYRITDYMFKPTTNWSTYVTSANKHFYVVVKAKTTNVLYDEARAEANPIWSSYYVNCDLSKWKIWYDITGSKCQYVYNNTAPRGGIYRMIDEYGNECPYDFKNLMFVDVTFNGGLVNVYTFSYHDIVTGDLLDLSLGIEYERVEMLPVTNNVIKYQPLLVKFKEYGVNKCANRMYYIQTLNTPVAQSEPIHDNIIGNGCRDVKIYNQNDNASYDNIVEDDCSGVYIGNGYKNTICRDSDDIKVLSSSFSNVIGRSCYDITIENGDRNIIGDFCDNIILQTGSGSNTFGDSCRRINLISYSCNNVFGSGCSYIRFNATPPPTDIVASTVGASRNIFDTDTGCLSFYNSGSGEDISNLCVHTRENRNQDDIEGFVGVLVPKNIIDTQYHIGSAHYTGWLEADGGIFDTSDERLKTFGDKIDVDFEEISKLKKHYFTWNRLENSTQQIGVSAQEIQKLYPELVHENGDGTLSVAYNKLSVVALAAIDKLYEENTQLKDAIKALSDRIDSIGK